MTDEDKQLVSVLFFEFKELWEAHVRILETVYYNKSPVISGVSGADMSSSIDSQTNKKRRFVSSMLLRRTVILHGQADTFLQLL